MGGGMVAQALVLIIAKRYERCGGITIESCDLIKMP